MRSAPRSSDHPAWFGSALEFGRDGLDAHLVVNPPLRHLQCVMRGGPFGFENVVRSGQGLTVLAGSAAPEDKGFRDPASSVGIRLPGGLNLVGSIYVIHRNVLRKSAFWPNEHRAR